MTGAAAGGVGGGAGAASGGAGAAAGEAAGEVVGSVWAWAAPALLSATAAAKILRVKNVIQQKKGLEMD